MTRFKKMEGYPDEIQGRFNSFITTQFDDSLSVEMQIRSLIKWISSSRELINDIVDYINLFIEMFDERLQEEIVGRLNEWLADGTLAQIINNDVFDMKADKIFVDSEIERLEQKDENIVTQLEQSIRYVNYDMFKEDGLSDNEIIQRTHIYANENNLPVINLTGEYWLDEPINIPIQTNVNFGQSVFHIDESKSKSGFGNFNVLPSRPKQVITLDQNKKTDLISQLKKGQTVINGFPEFKNHLVRVLDSNTNQFQRYLGGDPSTIWKLEDLFYVGDGGRLDGTIKYDFSYYTTLELYFAEEDYLIVEGGTFLLNGEGNPDINNGYVQNGFKINRSRVRFKNQYVGMEGTDTIGLDNNYSNGFYQYSYIYDLEFDNIKGLPRVHHQGEGTYGFSGHRLVKLTFKNIDAMGDDSYWGLTGHNKTKNVKVSHSRISRIDGHYDMENLTIEHSEIDNIAITGGGLLDIRHTIVNNDNLVNLRLDYGGHWDGDISIDNVTLKPNGNVRLLAFRTGGHNYLSDIVWGRNISLSNITVDMSNTTSNNSHTIFYADDGGQNSGYNKLTGFNSLKVKDINLTNSKGIGFRLGFIAHPQKWTQDKKGGYTINEGEINITTNSEIIVERVDTTGVASFLSSSVANNQALNAYSDYSFYPKVKIIDCGGISMLLNAMVVDIDLVRSTLRFVRAQLSATVSESRTKLSVYDSIIKLREPVTQRPLETNLFNVVIKPIENDSGVKNLTQTLMNTGLFQVNTTNKTTLNLVNCFEGVQLDNEVFDHLVGEVGADIAYELGNALILTNKFRRMKIIQNGSTTQRPVLNDTRNTLGHLYYDRILGKTIMFNGTNWVNVDGTDL